MPETDLYDHHSENGRVKTAQTPWFCQSEPFFRRGLQLKAASRGMLGDEVALRFRVIVTFGRVRNFETTCSWERKFVPIWQHSRSDLRHLECEHIKLLKIWGWYTVVSSPKKIIGCFGTGEHVSKQSQNSKILIYDFENEVGPKNEGSWQDLLQ